MGGLKNNSAKGEYERPPPSQRLERTAQVSILCIYYCVYATASILLCLYCSVYAAVSILLCLYCNVYVAVSMLLHLCLTSVDAG